MKKINLLIIMLCGLVAVACDSEVYNDDVIWDIAPVTLDIDIHDASGQSLLIPGADGSVVNSDISITYADEVYPADWSFAEQGSYSPGRAYLAKFYGVVYRPVYEMDDDGKVVDSGRRVLLIGEWDGATNFDVTFSLKISDTQTETFRVAHTFEMANNRIKDYTTTVWHNGSVADGEIVIVKK